MTKVLQGSNSRKYPLDKVIGQGSFGKVYLSGQYAIKQISLDLPPYLKTSLQTQIKILRSFNHPNIVSLVDIIYTPKHVYIIMEYCVMDLSKYMKMNKIDQGKARRILKQIISGFSQLIEKGIIHRDLKPANILVNSKGEFKLADFGFAKYVDHFDSKLLHSIVGTPLYMAPQILKKTKYTTKCDIWSIGFIYYELVTSKLPWNGGSEAELYSNIMKKPLVIPEYVSQWSAGLLRRMLVANEGERMGWEELVKYVLATEKCNGLVILGNNSSQNSQKQIALQRIQSNEQKFQNSLKNSNQISAKTSDLLLLFEIQLSQCFPEQKAHSMVSDKGYRFSPTQIQTIRKLLSNFTSNYQQFIGKSLKLRF